MYDCIRTELHIAPAMCNIKSLNWDNPAGFDNKQKIIIKRPTESLTSRKKKKKIKLKELKQEKASPKEKLNLS